MIVSNANSGPIVSIVVPVYGVQDYLDQCIESLVEQSYPNLEILLVDDGSPDACGYICDKWANADSRIKALHKTNGGLSDARNYGLERATGEYIYFVDSDDWIEPTLVEDALTASLEQQCEVVVFPYNTASDDGLKVTPSNDAQKFPRTGTMTSSGALRELWNDHIQNFAWSIFCKRSIYSDSIRFPKGRLMEDMATTYLIYAAANHVYFLNKPLVNYRTRNNSILGHKKPAISVDTVKNIEEIHNFAIASYPELFYVYNNWEIRYLSAALIWAYEARMQFNPDDYKSFTIHTKELLSASIKRLGFTHISFTNKLKVLPIYMNLIPLLTRISQIRSER